MSHPSKIESPTIPSPSSHFRQNLSRLRRILQRGPTTRQTPKAYAAFSIRICDRLIFDAYSASLELISGISNPKGGNQALSIRICDRHIFDAYSASLELSSGISSPKGGSQALSIRICDRHIFNAYLASLELIAGISNPSGKIERWLSEYAIDTF